jgi:hypothetical protein
MFNIYILDAQQHRSFSGYDTLRLETFLLNLLNQSNHF